MEMTTRARALYDEHRQQIFRRTDRLFAALMAVQWVCGVALASGISPYAWHGAHPSLHVHVYAAVLLGGAISSLPIALALLRPGWVGTRHVIAVAQMLWSALLIHLTGGRIETHFHVFGSLTFLAFYRDWRVLVPASAVVAADHFLRGLLWPESVYGVASAEWWRFLEHAFWVVYIDLFLIWTCVQSDREMRGIAERQAEVEALSESERRNRTLLHCQSEASVEGVLIVSEAGKVLSHNRRFVEQFRIPEAALAAGTSEALIGAAIHQFEEPEAVVARIKSLYASPDTEGVDELRLKDGRIIERHTAPVREDGGATLGRGWYFRDITDRVRVSEEVQALNTQLEARVHERTAALEAANLDLARSLAELRNAHERLALADRLASVGRLSAGIAHEINNPLSYVMSNLSFIERQLASQRTDAQGEMRESISEALHGADRVRRIIADLKMFARAGEERVEAVSLDEVLASSIKMAANEIRYRGRLTEDYGPVGPVRGDAGRLGQVFLNLIINAAQSLTKSRPDGNYIHVRTRSDQMGRAIVEITDTGEGIPAEIKNRLFDPFFTTKPIGVGTGLGLSICHGIVAAHGGEIEVESEVGVGSTFRVTLPTSVAAIAAPPVVAVDPIRGPRRRVLVVDDEPMILSSMKRTLSEMHDVEAVNGGQQAIHRLQQGARFDVILCDLMMPGITGMEVYGHVCAVSPEQARRMVFVTGGAFTAEAQAFLEQLGNPIVEKPVDIDRVNALIAAFQEAA